MNVLATGLVWLKNIGDLLTFWIFDAQSKQVLARSVVRPFCKNKKVKWDPAFTPKTVHTTAQHGGDLCPSSQEISKMLDNVEDDYDKDETVPKPHTPETILKRKKTVVPVNKSTTPETKDMASHTS